MLQAAGSIELLTTRETEVLRRVALGPSNKDIATALAVGDGQDARHACAVEALGRESRAGDRAGAKRGLVSLDELQ